jgi:hypothetical protein
MTDAQINATSYSSVCKVVLKALSKYGMYMMDTGGGNNAIITDGAAAQNQSSNPWYNTFDPIMKAAGDGTGTGTGFTNTSCMNRLGASNFKMYEIQPLAGSSGNTTY